MCLILQFAMPQFWNQLIALLGVIIPQNWSHLKWIIIWFILIFQIPNYFRAQQLRPLVSKREAEISVFICRQQINIYITFVWYLCGSCTVFRKDLPTPSSVQICNLIERERIDDFQSQAPEERNKA